MTLRSTAAAQGFLSVAEIAAVAGVPSRSVYRVLEDIELPAEFVVSEGRRRWFSLSASGIVAFHASIFDAFTHEGRKEIIAALVDAHRTELATGTWRHAPGSLAVVWRRMTLDASAHFQDAAARLEKLEAARERIVSDRDIMGGTPCIAGTRVPARHLAAAVGAGLSVEAILADYPSIERKDVELADLWSRATPPQGRPRRIRPDPGATIVRKRVTLRPLADEVPH